MDRGEFFDYAMAHNMVVWSAECSESAFKAFDKLAKIEQIVDGYKTDNPREPYYDTEVYMDNIVEVLENG